MAKFVAMLEFTDDKDVIGRARPAHREYLQTLLDDGKVWMSGPWTDDTGAMLIFEVENLSEAERLLAEDPYQDAGVVTASRVREWKMVFGPTG